MPELVWDALDQRFFERGVSHGVLYTPAGGVYGNGVSWSGLTAVNESPSGAESNKQYADNIVYVNLLSAEEFNATIEAFMFPVEFLAHDGVTKTANGLQVGMQGRPVFGFSWQNLKGSAEDEDLGFVLNMAYGLQASPSEKSNATVNESPELKQFSWSVSSTPIVVPGFKPTAISRVDSTDSDVDPAGLEALLDELYGRGAIVTANLPLPDEADALLAVGP
jgi:hypothetical protein